MITFWIAFGEQFDFSKKGHEICNMGSVEDQKRTNPKFSGEGFNINISNVFYPFTNMIVTPKLSNTLIFCYKKFQS